MPDRPAASARALSAGFPVAASASEWTKKHSQTRLRHHLNCQTRPPLRAKRSNAPTAPAPSRESPRALSSALRLSPFFFQAEDGIRALYVTGVQTCALPI